MVKMDISVEEWLEELNRLDECQKKADAKARTTEQLCEMFGHSRRWVCDRLREAMNLGRIRCVQKKDTNLAGRPCWKPAYLLVRQPKKKG